MSLCMHRYSALLCKYEVSPSKFYCGKCTDDASQECWNQQALQVGFSFNGINMLSVHLQALFPSPLYFFDEVDCALDSLAAGRVAAFVRAQCNGSSSSTSRSNVSKASMSKGAAAMQVAAKNGSAAAAAAVVMTEAACEDSDTSVRTDTANIRTADGMAAAKSDVIDAAERAAAGGGERGVGAQYLLVSHRPNVFESASCLLGVYSNGRGSSAAVVAHF
jgi:hypothetical protein